MIYFCRPGKQTIHHIVPARSWEAHNKNRVSFFLSPFLEFTYRCAIDKACEWLCVAFQGKAAVSLRKLPLRVKEKAKYSCIMSARTEKGRDILFFVSAGDCRRRSELFSAIIIECRQSHRQARCKQPYTIRV